MTVENEVVDLVQSVEGEQTQTSPEHNEIEQEARLQGWVPKEEFRGKETDWIEAEIFVQRGREINPILRKNNERIQKELDKAKRDLAELRIGVDEFKKFQKEAYDRKVANFEVELSELREQKKAAISSGDGELAVQLDDKIDAVKEAKAAAKEVAKEPVKPEETKEDNPKVADWVERNVWYKNSKAMSTATNAIAAEIREQYPFYNEDQFLTELDKRLEDTFSMEKLGRKVKPRSPVEGGNTSTSATISKGKHSYDSLPDEAKKACDSFIKQGLIKNKEEYVKEYYA